MPRQDGHSEFDLPDPAVLASMRSRDGMLGCIQAIVYCPQLRNELDDTEDDSQLASHCILELYHKDYHR